VHQPGDHQRADRDDECVGGHGKPAASLPHAAQVTGQQHDDDGDADPHGRRLQGLECRGHGRHAGRDRHRDRHDVVDQQAGGSHQAGDAAKLLGGDDVRPAAFRVCADRLPEGNADRQHQQHDRSADWQGVRQARRAS